jgi:hypothetical protein
MSLPILKADERDQMSLPILKADECELMSPELVTRYNNLATLFNEAVLLPRLAAQVKQMMFAPARAEGESGEQADYREAQSLKWIADRLGRERIQVGFLGRNQIGKSATLNGILDVDKGRAPSEEGNLKATTSVITRIRFRPTGNDTLALKYQPSQY